ncbi:MAG: ribosome silencing factor [Steroidobacteraceae bacterium]
MVKSVVAALEDMKATHIKVMDVRKITDVSDCMVLASGNSDRHVRSIADRVIERCKAAGFRPMGLEGEREGEWVLVDLNDVIVHVMLPRVREFYGLEELWEPVPARPNARSVKGKPKAKAHAKAKAKSKSKSKSKSKAASGKKAAAASPPRRKPSGGRKSPQVSSRSRG